MIFEADPAYIASLDSVMLVQLMKRLMLAESRLAGIPLRNAAAPLQVTVADGGEDGRVEWTGGLQTTAYLPNRFTLFQSKAQKLGESAVRAEVLKKPRKGSPKLSDAINEVISRGGAYIMFCREPMVTEKRKKLVKAIKAAISEGGGNPKKVSAIEVYDANLIADWVNAHQSVALWLASQRFGRPLQGFQTHESWGRAPEISSVTWKPSNTPRFSPSNRRIPTSERVDPSRDAWTFQQAADAIKVAIANERAIIRVFGPSGFGKTRFVYEVLGPSGNIADEVDSTSVIYADGFISGDEAVKLALEMADSAMSIILVVDDCSDGLHSKLAQMVQRANSRLRLITIDIETRVLQAKDTLTLRVERTDDENIKAIAKGIAPALSDADTSFISDLAEGFPRMAVVAAQQNGDGRQTLQSVEQVLDRIIWGNKPRVVNAQKVLEVASLFEWLGFQGRVESQVEFVANTLASMSTTEFVEHLLSFRSRGALTQRGDFVQVGPIPLAARLGLQRLSVLTSDQLHRFFEQAPIELKNSFLKRLKWLDTSATAKAFAQRLLMSDQLGNASSLNTEFGSKTLDYLAHVDPDSVAVTVDRVFGNLTTDELKTARDGRRHLVWTLDKLVFRKASFNRAARLLRRLAAAENETWGNNATGEFKRLYQLYLSGTEANPAARLLVLDEGLESADLREREICVEALDVMLNTGHFTRSGGSEQIGSGERLKDWAPKTYGEIRDFYRAALKRLTNIATSKGPLAANAKNVIGSNIRSLITQLPLEEVASVIDTIISQSGFWPKALNGISDWLYFDRKDSPEDISVKVRALYDRILPTDPVELAILYTSGWQASLHDPDTNFDRSPDSKHDYEYSARQARLVAERIALDGDLVQKAVERLACSDAKNAYPFAHQLVRSISDPTALFMLAVQVADANSSPANRQFFSGIIAGAAERDSKLAKRFVRSALQSSKLKVDAISLVSSGPIQADDISLVIDLLQSKDVSPWQCASLSYGRGLDHLPVDAFIPLLEELERQGPEGLWTIIEIANMHHYGGTKNPTKGLTKLLKRVLTTPALLEKNRNNMDGFNLEQTVERFAKLGEITQAYAKSLTKNLLRICRHRSDNLFYELDDPLRKILGALVAIHPDEVWSEISKKIESKSWDVRFYIEHLLAASFRNNHLSRGLSFPVPPKIYLAWVRNNPEKRASTAVSWIPIADKNEDGSLRWAGELLDFVAEFGEQKDVLAALSRRLRPTSYWGSMVPYLQPLLPLLETLLVRERSTVRRWAENQIDVIRKQIALEEKSDAEDVVRLS